MTETLRLALLALVLSGWQGTRADQLAVVTAREAEGARRVLLADVQAGSGTGTVVTFCSLCENDAPAVWAFTDVRTVDYRRPPHVLFSFFGHDVTFPRLQAWRTVELFGRPVRIAGTNEIVAGVAHPADWRADTTSVARWEELDLAYVYRGTGAVLSCFADQLRLPCNLNATALVLRAASPLKR